MVESASASGSKHKRDDSVKCCSCGGTNIKYRCPRCERITCSLQCCLDHKKEYDCDGKRDRTKYVDIQSFTDANLTSVDCKYGRIDYFFLEEVARSTNTANRARSQLGLNARRYGQASGCHGKKRKISKGSQHGSVSAINPHISGDWLSRFPVAVQSLVTHASNRGTSLTLLAPGMSKRVRNTSYVDVKNNRIFWRVEWDFPSANVPVDLFEQKASESETLFRLLGQYLTRTHVNTIECSQGNASICGKLKKYAVPDWEKHIMLLLRKEFTPASQPQYYRLDGMLSLESNLKRKAIVEFPVIIVVLHGDEDQYPIAYDAIEIITVEEMNESGEQENADMGPTENGDEEQVAGIDNVPMDSSFVKVEDQVMESVEGNAIPKTSVLIQEL